MWLNPHHQGVTLSIRLTPSARQEGVQGRHENSLKISVNAVPENGKANAALIALLAKILKLPKSTMSLVSGDTQRNKTLLIAGDPQSLLPHVREKLEKFI